jgi:hypothetical protein
MNNDLIEQYLPAALEAALAWDLRDDELAGAVNAQARLNAGLSPDDYRPDPYAC